MKEPEYYNSLEIRVNNLEQRINELERKAADSYLQWANPEDLHKQKTKPNIPDIIPNASNKLIVEKQCGLEIGTSYFDNIAGFPAVHIWHGFTWETIPVGNHNNITSYPTDLDQKLNETYIPELKHQFECIFFSSKIAFSHPSDHENGFVIELNKDIQDKIKFIGDTEPAIEGWIETKDDVSLNYYECCGILKLFNIQIPTYKEFISKFNFPGNER